ncbi:uncharacterized protein BX664DRAFT_324178 [Halteromyces radiatus]|uniref:uncharacterized protein n=1 Tax=Halteromyces radiatus TaxID=101107 RepID=UPI00221E6536|nr:uncharacterized protein BX664DRAFT_324178 [Halteromyces radiatus]KAI8096521.1 hypothetical protein BX664DRAFT_324178 [Halteromyces radiatus]
MPSSSPTYRSVPLDDTPTSAVVKVRKQSKSFVAAVMLIICIISFVLQTELAQYVQKTSNYQKPYFILYIGHACYILMIPIQFTVECIHTRWFALQQQEKPSWQQHIRETMDYCRKQLKEAIIELEDQVQGKHQHYTSFLLRTGLILSILFTIPAYLWYLSVNLISMSTLTVIFNTGCFWAYVFSIFMLGDSILLSKCLAVGLSVLGVVVMALGQDKQNDTDDNMIMQQQSMNIATTTSSLTSIIGLNVAVVAALTYGFYEVYYKKYATPPRPSVLFANMMTGGIGAVTLLVLWIPIPILHYSGWEIFELPDGRTFAMIMAIGSMSVIYNASMMCVIALVSPVFAAVGVLLTIPVVAITDMFVTGVMVSFTTILGSAFILVGFIILNRQIAREEDIALQDVCDTGLVRHDTTIA